MSEQAIKDKPETALPAGKTRVERVHSYLGVISTALGITGAVGTGVVWAIANFYTGQVAVSSEIPMEPVVVKVYDLKGRESVFHTSTFQIFPGEYHVDVVLPEGKTKHFDLTVNFNETSKIEIKAPVKAQDEESKRRWWQFWRQKNQNDASKNSTPADEGHASELSN